MAIPFRESKFRAMAAQLRAAILNGSYSAGGRLPTRMELAERFQTTNVRVQKALDVLIEEGLVYSRGCLGTFVSETPPQARPYALTFPSEAGELNSCFYRTILSEARKRSGKGSFEVFHGIDVRRDLPDYARLVERVQSHAVAGLIFGAYPRTLWDSPVVREPSMPKVIIQGGPPSDRLPSVYPDTTLFLPRAMEYLASRGRRRVAVITLVHVWGDRPAVDDMQKLASQHGLMMRAEWLQGVHAEAAFWGEQVGRLLFSPGRGPRPDALVITDDNLVPYVTAGLLAAGVKAPREVEIVAQANFPQPTPSALPATRLGFDIGRLLDLCLERIDQQRRGEKPALRTALPPVFEEELAERAKGQAVSGKQKEEALL